MNRKNTILLAVFINAGLLVVLFVTALTSQEEIAIPPTHEMGAAEIIEQASPAPLFGDEIDVAMREPSECARCSEESVEVEPSTQAPIVHQLPPLAPEAIAATAPAAEKVEQTFDQVIVKKGDSLEKIAREHKTTVDEIVKLNRLPSHFLRIGQVLKLPSARTVAAKAPASKPLAVEKNTAGPDYYTVKMGDNPWTIAMKHHLKVDELLKLNGLNEEKARKLKPGDRLRIR